MKVLARESDWNFVGLSAGSRVDATRDFLQLKILDQLEICSLCHVTFNLRLVNFLFTSKLSTSSLG
jgi:hypothetical protein